MHKEPHATRLSHYAKNQPRYARTYRDSQVQVASPVAVNGQLLNFTSVYISVPLFDVFINSKVHSSCNAWHLNLCLALVGSLESVGSCTVGIIYHIE